MDQAKEEAKKHWEYVKAVLEHTGCMQPEIQTIGFHYMTAFEHGWKHALESIKHPQNS